MEFDLRETGYLRPLQTMPQERASNTGNLRDDRQPTFIRVADAGNTIDIADSGLGNLGGELLMDEAHNRGRKHRHPHRNEQRNERKVERKPPAPPSEPPPSIRAMLTQSLDLRRAAQNNSEAPDFIVERTSEAQFKERYVDEALRVGRQAGFSTATTKDMVRRIYAFEAGGWGTNDTLSGMREPMMTAELTDQRERFTPASSAIGYNQVIRPTTLYLMHESGQAISKRLQEMADQTTDPERKRVLEDKSQIVSSLATTVDRVSAELPNARKHYDNNGKPSWNLFAQLAKTDTPVVLNMTGRQLGNAIHALNMDKDVGPLIQTENLRLLIHWAQKHNVRDMLRDRVKTISTRAKEYDALPQERRMAAVDEVAQVMREVGTATTNPDTLQQLQKLETAAAVEQKIRDLRAGNDHSLGRSILSAGENRMLRTIIAHAGGLDNNPKTFSPDAKMLVAKIIDSHFQGASGDELLPAALELGNLVGTGRALQMLRPDAASKPASKFFSADGYKANPIAHRRTASQLLMAIYRQMNRSERGGSAKAGLNELMSYLDNAREE